MIQVREANNADNSRLLKLTSKASMDGRLAIIIERNPDFFRLTEARGRSKVFVAQKGEEIIGSVSISQANGFWQNRKAVISYLADLKIDPENRGGIILWLLIKKLRKYLNESDSRLVSFVVATGNKQVERFLKQRKGLPPISVAGELFTYQLFPKTRRRIAKQKFEIIEVKSDELESSYLDFFFNDYLRKYDLAPETTTRLLKESIVYLAKEKGEIVSAISLVDMGNCKQNVVLKIPLQVKAVLLCLKVIKLIIPSLEVPALGKALKILYVKYYAYLPGRKDALRELIKIARWKVYNEGYHFLSLSVDRNEIEVRSIFRFDPKICFISKLFYIILKGDGQDTYNHLRRLFYHDISVV